MVSKFGTGGFLSYDVDASSRSGSPTGKEGLGLYRDNGKEHGNYYGV